MPAVAPPVVGETEYHRAYQPSAESLLDLPGKHFGFRPFTLAQRIHAQLTQQKRLGFGQSLEAGQVIAKSSLLVQVDVETDEIDVLRMQELGGRIVGERAKAFRVCPLCLQDQFIDKIAHRGHTAPAHDVRRDLVDNAESKNRRMLRAIRYRLADRRARLLPALFGIQKAQVLIPGNVNKQLQALLLREVEQPPGRNVIHAKDIGSQSSDQGKIFECPLGRSKEGTCRIRLEGPIGHAFDVKFFFAYPEEFSVHANARPRRSRSSHGL